MSSGESTSGKCPRECGSAVVAAASLVRAACEMFGPASYRPVLLDPTVTTEMSACQTPVTISRARAATASMSQVDFAKLARSSRLLSTELNRRTCVRSWSRTRASPPSVGETSVTMTSTGRGSPDGDAMTASRTIDPALTSSLRADCRAASVQPGI